MDPNIQSLVREWAGMQPQLEQAQQRLMILKKREADLHDKITRYVLQNKLEASVLKLSGGGTIRFQQATKYPQITHKFLIQCLEDYAKQHNGLDASKLMQYILSCRTTQKTWFMKKYMP
jgi:hypothetical protein